MVLKVEVLSLKHRPSHWYIDMRQECHTLGSVTSRSCDWLLLVLAMRTRETPLTIPGFRRTNQYTRSLLDA